MAVGWRRADWLIVLGALVAGAAIRLWLLPMEGLRGDLDQFVGWVHHIATRGLGSLYGETAAGPVTFGPGCAGGDPTGVREGDGCLRPGDPGPHEGAGDPG
jgi:hypothetical protein